ncbi:MAG: cytochrome c3 family protein [Chloroflexota bacterium]
MFTLPRRQSRGVLAVTLISACAALILLGQQLSAPVGVYAAPSEQARPTTHPVEGRENCTMCHQPGGGVKPAPADHAGRASDSCVACHKPAGAAPAAQQQPKAPAAAPQEQPKPQPAEGSGTTTPADQQPAQPAQSTPLNADPAPEAAKADLASATATCRSCHNKPEFRTVSEISSRPDTVKQLESDRVYAHRFISCVTCHQGDPHKTMAPVTKTTIADACGKCHTTQRQEHIGSVHGESLASGGKDAATCIDCHSTQNNPHSIARVLSPDSPAYRSSVASTCAKCHAKNEVMEKYDVPTEVYETYTSTFHGKANILSPYEITQHPKATCVNCHGYHDIKAESDPTSPVAPANLANTCGGCHPGAGEQFASGWLGHKEATPQQFPVVYFAERFFFFFTSSVLAFGFIFMVALELGSWILRRKSTQH